MPKKICLVDGSGYIFRAFYGLPPMTSPSGVPVNAVYGFTNMFLKLTNKIDCDYNLVLFDAKRQNFRNDFYPEYKATRKDTPEDLIPQFPIIREAVSALKLNQLEMEGFEADDLIATYTSKALNKGMEVVIVSADKDLMQLIRPGVSFYDPMKDKFFTPEDVKEKFGVYPEKVPDVQALSGDSTDNVPGVPGIGPKTAAELVNTYGSLEGVLTHAGEIKQNKRRETLLANIENAKISLRLVTLKSDVPVERDVEDYPFHCPDISNAEAFVDKYGFNSLRLRVLKWVEEQCVKKGNIAYPKKNEIEAKYCLASNSADLENWLKTAYKYQKIALKCFTDGSNPVFDDIKGIALATEDGNAIYIPIVKAKESGEVFDLFSVNNLTETKGLNTKELIKILLPVLSDNSVLKVGINIKSDMHFISKLFSEKIKIFPYDDIAIISYVLDSTNHGHGLRELAELFLDKKMQNPDVVFGTGKQKIAIENVEASIMTSFACEQADFILRILNVLRPRLLSEHMVTVYEHFDRPLVATLFDMEQNGVMVDSVKLSEFSKYLEQRLRSVEADIYQLAGEEFNIASPKQLGEILYNKLGLQGKKHSSGNFQTGADVLEQMAEEHPLPEKILEWRGINKLKTTYTDTLLQQLDKNSRIHTTYDQANVNTGRLSSNNPNLQNIPVRSEDGQKIRQCFIAKQGYKLISADYSQVELRLLAVLADVKALKEAFAEGIDIHTATAMKVFGLTKEQVTPTIRRNAKAINFGVIYGISQYGLAKQIDVTPAEAKKYIDAYFEKMPEIKVFMDKTIAFARKFGYVVTPFGRKCAVPGINDKNKRIVAFAERAAMNAPLQGGAADIMKRAMNNMFNALNNSNFQSKMLLQVHDEIVVEAPENEVENICKLIKNVMEQAVDYDVKFIADVGIGDNWSQAH
ncbi:MAG: DNA polymerase I [Alphaproteobacteria bacterium]|nr:DNA polymerase I [Alphaproteobacteria bacterium]